MARLAHETMPPTLFHNDFTLHPASGGWGSVDEKSKNSQRHQGKCYARSLCNIAARMANDVVRADKMEYSNHVVRFYATVIGTREIYDDEKSGFEDNIHERYCTGNLNLYAKAKVSVAYSIKYTSAAYGNTGWEFKVAPEDC
jgi:hypothetical protein